LAQATEAVAKAERLFKTKEQRAEEGAEAMAEYKARLDEVRAKTARLRALRLARDAAKETPRTIAG
jgi:histidinol dehydrogenase